MTYFNDMRSLLDTIGKAVSILERRQKRLERELLTQDDTNLSK